MQNEIKASWGGLQNRGRSSRVSSLWNVAKTRSSCIEMLSNIEKWDWNEVRGPQWFAYLWSEMLVAISLRNSRVKLACIGLSFPVTRLPNAGAPSFTLAYYFWHSFSSAAQISKSTRPLPLELFERKGVHRPWHHPKPYMIVWLQITSFKTEWRGVYAEHVSSRKPKSPEKSRVSDDRLPLMSPKGRTANQDHLPFFLPKCVTQMIGNVVLSDTPLVVRCHFGKLGHGYLLLFCSLKSKLPCGQVSHPRIDCNMTWSTAFV